MFPRAAPKTTTSSKLDIFSAANFLSPHQSADPALSELATYLRTHLGVPPLDRYDDIAVMAHSMGGLVVQRAIVDSDEVRGKLTDLLLSVSQELERIASQQPELEGLLLPRAQRIRLRVHEKRSTSAEP